MADTYWAEREGSRWDVYGKQRGWMAQADTEDDARLIVAGLEALQAPPAAVPAGYVPVPVEPTQGMLDAAGMCIVPDGKEWLDQSNRETWAAMLAAARKGE